MHNMGVLLGICAVAAHQRLEYDPALPLSQLDEETLMFDDFMRKKLKDFKWRNRYCFARTFFLTKILRNVRKYEANSPYVSENTVFSNLRRILENNKLHPHPSAKYFLGVDLNQGAAKSGNVVEAFSKIPEVAEKIKDLKVLSIGPRTEGELYAFFAHGFEMKNIQGVDLFSYSPKITPADMHDLPFEDNSFNVVMMGWCIAYSDNKYLAASEAARVLVDGGYLIVGVSYSPKSNEQIIKERGYLIGSEERLTSLKLVAQLFGDRLENVKILKARDDGTKRPQQNGQIILMARVKKREKSMADKMVAQRQQQRDKALADSKAQDPKAKTDEPNPTAAA